MKKIVLATASALALIATTQVSTVQADSNFKSGFKVGGGVGYKHHRVKNVSNIDSRNLNVINESFVESSIDNTAVVQLHAGYDLIVNRFFSAFDVDYRYSPSEVNMRFNTAQAIFVPTAAPFEVKQRHPHDFGLSARLGALVTENLALYAIGNVRLGKFEHEFLNKKPTATALARKVRRSQYLWGIGGGIGARYAFSKGFSVAFETTYDVYQRIKLNSEDVVFAGVGKVAEVNTRSKAPHIFIAMLKMSKTF
ncbi:MAG TPA: hypothetical protein DD412_00940 [Holosporales bacterium]|nr:hypothetical protein [Holosporales bacterium]